VAAQKKGGRVKKKVASMTRKGTRKLKHSYLCFVEKSRKLEVLLHFAEKLKNRPNLEQ